jgi:hypothetical protein
MHFNPILLVQADSLEDAKDSARDFCERECGEHSFFDFGDIVEDKDTEWNKPLNEVKDKLPENNHLEEAEQFIARANTELEREDFYMAGYYFRKAGELFSECFSTEHKVFNIQYYDYSWDYGEGWFAIEADLHF